MEEELKIIRKEFEMELETLLITDIHGGIDNTPPLYFGFSLGHLLTFHGENNRELREKLYRVYMRYCPALAQGYFIDMDKLPSMKRVVIQENSEPDVKEVQLGITGPEEDNAGRAHNSNKRDGNRQKRIGFFSRFFHAHHQVGHLMMGLVPVLVKAGYHVTIFAVGIVILSK